MKKIELYVDESEATRIALNELRRQEQGGDTLFLHAFAGEPVLVSFEDEDKVIVVHEEDNGV